MKALILIIFTVPFLFSCTTTKKSENPPNIIILDSNFAPVHINNQIMPRGKCYLINENNEKISQRGPCFDKKKWERLKLKDQSIINAYLEANARKKSPLASKWQKIKTTTEAKEIKNTLQLVTHGSRSFYLADKYSQHKAVPILVRNVTSTVGGVQNNEDHCGLKKWTSKELKKFKDGGLQDHQRYLSDIISQNPSVAVVNISLGYKKAWIREDNPKCKEDQVNIEYQVLQSSWRNLLMKHNNVLFVVAAGNEGDDFSKKTIRNNDLWGSLSDESNLVLVGSVNAFRKRASFSNYGITNMYWALGQDIPITYPHPIRTNGYPSMVHGTSSSAAVISGKILKALLDGVKFNDLQKLVSTNQ